MKVILLVLAVVSLASEVHGFFEIRGNFGVERGNVGQGGPTFGRVCRGGHHNMFPKCKDFMREVHNKLRETGSGPRTCRDAGDQDECKFQETMKARMAANCKPTEHCLSQIHDFLIGSHTYGEYYGGSSSW